MNIDELKEYRKKLGKLTEEERKKRDLYLKKLAKNNWLIVQSAGDVTRISWQFKTMEEVIDVITQH